MGADPGDRLTMQLKIKVALKVGLSRGSKAIGDKNLVRIAIHIPAHYEGRIMDIHPYTFHSSDDDDFLPSASSEIKFVHFEASNLVE